MIDLKNRGLCLLAFALACGGGGSEVTEENAARTAGGETIRTAGGGAVSVEAHNNWQEGLRMYARFRQEGWNESNCSTAIAKFEEANASQGGNFAEAQYMAGLVAQT